MVKFHPLTKPLETNQITESFLSCPLERPKKLIKFIRHLMHKFIINPILIQVYPRKWGWLDLAHSNSNLSNSHSPSRSIYGILLLQTNILALILHLFLPHLLWSSSLPLALHFKLQCFSQNMLIIPPQHMPVPSHSIRLYHICRSRKCIIVIVYNNNNII